MSQAGTSAISAQACLHVRMPRETIALFNERTARRRRLRPPTPAAATIHHANIVARALAHGAGRIIADNVRHSSASPI